MIKQFTIRFHLDPLSQIKKEILPVNKWPFIFTCLFLLVGFSSSLYANNTWTLAGDLNNSRNFHTATTLNNGQVLVSGGDTDSVLLDSAELFDSATSLWTLTTSMNIKRKNHAAVLLDDGRVLVTGGSGTSSDLASAEIFDPATANWSIAANMSTSRVNALVTKLQDGRVLVSSGTSNGSALTSAEIYDPSANTWTLTGAMLSDSTHTSAAVLLTDGRVFIKGDSGYINGPTIDASVTPWPVETPSKLPQIYDPASNNWSAASPMNRPKRGGTSIVLNDGTVLIAGGEVFQDFYWGYPYFSCVFPAEIYHPDTDSWTETGTMTYSQSNPSKVALLPDGKVLAFGPSMVFDPYSSCGSDNGLTEIYDPSTGTWSATDTATVNHGRGGEFSSLMDGKVLSIGGGTLSGIVEIYTPSGASPEPPPRSEILHVGDIDGESVELNNYPYYSWSATATFTILDENDEPVEGASVSSMTSTVQTVPYVCTTDTLGQCDTEVVSSTYSDRRFWVTDVTKPLMTYDASANTDPDGDSDGTIIIIQRGDGPTLPPPAPESVHVGDMDGSSENSGRRRWRASVSISILNQNGDPESNTEVMGSWSGGASGTATCTTDSNGDCNVTSSRIKNSKSTATFTVTDVVNTSISYDSTLNSDPDGDSNGTSITVGKP